MTPQRYEQLRECFSATCDLDDDAQREYLKDACAKDPSLSHDLERLLRADMTADGPFNDDETTSMERRTRFLRALEAIRAADEVPSRIGRYAIQRRIGSGGMGVVFEATQEQPQRSVAIKLLHLPLDSETAAKRFELEAQALALLHHPGIAQVFETGAADVDGRRVRYLAMEYVRGETILEYAEQQGLDTDRRLELMARICDAVHHAHQKGVIHRDLKPGNIIVDEAGQPKILDFGVARITNGDIEGATAPTAAGDIIGTVAYMSPEQACGDPAEIDIRTDVYSLGVICFELLSGRSPYDTSRRQIPEAVRIICDDEPTRLSSIDRAFRGDIETLVGKAMEKEKDRRYPSASEFAADIRRYLSDEPIVARPTTAWYQMRKFARRNRGLVAGVGVLIATLSLGAVGTTWGWRSAAERQLDAEAEAKRALAASERAEVAREKAEFEARRTQAITTFFLNLIRSAAAAQTLGRDVTVRELLRSAQSAASVGSLPTDPSLRVEVLNAIGQTLLWLAEYDAALKTLKQAMGVADDNGLSKDELTSLRGNFALSLLRTGSSAKALAIYTDLIQALEGSDTDLLFVLQMKTGAASALSDLGQLNEAAELMDEVVNRALEVFGPDDFFTLESMQSLAAYLQGAGHHAEAETVIRTALSGLRRTLSDDHPTTLIAINNLATILYQQGRYDEAVEWMTLSLEGRSRVYGERNPVTLIAMNNLGLMLAKTDRVDEALRIAIQAFELRAEVLGEMHPQTLTSRNNVASVLTTLGRYPEAVVAFEEVAEARSEVLGESHPLTLAAQANVAGTLRVMNRHEEALSIYESVVPKEIETFGDHHPRTMKTRIEHGRTLKDMKRYPEARVVLEEVIIEARRTFGDRHPTTLDARSALALVMQESQAHEEAEAEWTSVLDDGRILFGPENPEVRLWEGNYGALLIDMGRLDEAEVFLVRAYEGFQAARGLEHPSVKVMVENLVTLYEDWRKPTLAERYREVLRERWAKTSAEN